MALIEIDGLPINSMVDLFFGKLLVITRGFIYIYIYIWVNYNDLTATSLEIMVNKRNHPQMALFQGSELL